MEFLIFFILTWLKSKLFLWPCRSCSYRTVQKRQPVAEGLHWAGGPSALPDSRGRSSDHAALRPAGGSWTAEWTLLLLLRCTGNGGKGQRWCRGPEVVGVQWDAVRPLLKWTADDGLEIFFSISFAWSVNTCITKVWEFKHLFFFLIPDLSVVQK